MTRPLLASFTLLLGSVLVTPPAVAQPPSPSPSGVPATAGQGGVDGRWASWLGCWRAEGDTAGRGTRVCVMPVDGGVTLHTIAGGQRVSQETRVADGVSRPVQEADCRGTEQVRWSADGRRAFRTATASCDAEGPRSLASVTFLVPGPVWVEVQTVTHQGATNVRVSRYVRALNQRLPDGSTATAARAAAPPVGRGWTTDDVTELSAVLPPDGVQAAIGEGPVAFRLNATSLAHLADAGVSEGVIDLMVAMTYPEKFVVDRAADRGWSGGGLDTPSLGDPFFSPIVGAAALYDCYSPYGWATASYWAGCSGYDPYLYRNRPGFNNGYYNGYYGVFGSPWVATQVPSAGSGSPTPQGDGRVVNGRGYTQVRPVEASSIQSGQYDGSASGTTSVSGSGSPSGGATSSGYSGGGAGSGGGERTAVPRPPGH